MLGYTIGLRALLSAQRSIDVIGQNLANSATPGYSRRTVEFGATDPFVRAGVGVFGTGVTIADIQRVHDDLLENQLRVQQQGLGRLDGELEVLTLLDGLFADVDGNGVSSRLNEFFASISAATTGPHDPVLRGAVVHEGSALAAGIRQLASQLAGVGELATGRVEGLLEEVNALASRLAALNHQIQKTSGGGPAAADLLDEQNRVLGSLAELVDVQVVPRNGQVDVLVDGLLLVSGDRADALEVSSQDASGVSLKLASSGKSITLRSGRLTGLASAGNGDVNQALGALDAFTRALLREVNHVHSTGIPGTGPYHSLEAEFAVSGGDLGVPLSALDLAFPLQAGRLVVNVHDEQTGTMRQHEIAVDPGTMSLLDLQAALDAIPDLTAGLDSSGHLRLSAAAGFGFDFSARLDPDPDDEGTFGSSRATLTGGPGPYALSAGDSLTVDVDGAGPQTVTFLTTDFQDITAATAEEVAQVLTQSLVGARATVVDGRVVLQSLAAGTTSSLVVADAAGSPAAALGLSTAPEAGTDAAVRVALSGVPDAPEGHYEVRPLSDGVLGATPGLLLEVLDANGNVLGTVDVGQGYTPGEPVEILPGVDATFSAGSVSATSGDRFAFEVVEDSDSAGVLVGLGLAGFFTGSDARSIAVAEPLREDPRALAASAAGSGDGGNLLRLLELKDAPVSGLEGRTLPGRFADLVVRIGQRAAAAESGREAQDLVVAALETRRGEISGVNVDEEVLKLVELEQLHTAASRFLAAVTEIQETVLNLV